MKTFFRSSFFSTAQESRLCHFAGPEMDLSKNDEAAKDTGRERMKQPVQQIEVNNVKDAPTKKTPQEIQQAQKGVDDVQGWVGKTQETMTRLETNADQNPHENENTQQREKAPDLQKYSPSEQQEADRFLKMETQKLSPELQKSYEAILSKLSPDERAAITEYGRSFENSFTAKTGMKTSEDNFVKNVLFAGIDKDYSSATSAEALLNQCADECKSNMSSEKNALMKQAYERLEKEAGDYRNELQKRPANDPERKAYEGELKAFHGDCERTEKEIGDSLKGDRENAMRDLSSSTLPQLMEKVGKQIGHKIQPQENKDANPDKNRNKAAFTITDVSKEQAKPIMDLAKKMLNGAAIELTGKDIKIEQADSLEAQNFLNRLKNEKLPKMTTK
ncbi:hypothetical protein HY213_02605 [Candidatus Peregrinibacteria bacterium]|nr:hypothetical protein [Candidatus Peregrinibacteria bacterium]